MRFAESTNKPHAAPNSTLSRLWNFLKARLTRTDEQPKRRFATLRPNMQITRDEECLRTTY
ncbi:MAG: hypothetical protein ACKVZJ_14190 [Phycisphaerales bacterium]